jgi:hypothetical protein
MAAPPGKGRPPGRLASALAQGRSLEGTGAQLAQSKVLSCQGFAAAPLSRWIVASPTVRAELKGRQKAFMVVVPGVNYVGGPAYLIVAGQLLSTLVGIEAICAHDPC